MNNQNLWPRKRKQLSNIDQNKEKANDCTSRETDSASYSKKSKTDTSSASTSFSGHQKHTLQQKKSKKKSKKSLQTNKKDNFGPKKDETPEVYETQGEERVPAPAQEKHSSKRENWIIALEEDNQRLVIVDDDDDDDDLPLSVLRSRQHDNLRDKSFRSHENQLGKKSILYSTSDNNEPQLHYKEQFPKEQIVDRETHRIRNESLGDQITEAAASVDKGRSLSERMDQEDPKKKKWKGWSLKLLEDGEPCITGTLVAISSYEDVSHCIRISAHSLLNPKDNTVHKLVGKLNGIGADIPKFIRVGFRKGFPKDWRMLLKQWIKMHKEEKDKKLEQWQENNSGGTSDASTTSEVIPKLIPEIFRAVLDPDDIYLPRDINSQGGSKPSPEKVRPVLDVDDIYLPKDVHSQQLGAACWKRGDQNLAQRKIDLCWNQMTYICLRMSTRRESYLLSLVLQKKRARTYLRVLIAEFAN